MNNGHGGQSWLQNGQKSSLIFKKIQTPEITVVYRK